jgi:hypothetical protein
MAKRLRLHERGAVGAACALVLAMTCGVGCGAPADTTGKDGRPVQTSPNDPNGTANPPNPNLDEPADPNADDNLEQPVDGECTPPETAMPEGWVTHSMKNFSVTTPASMSVAYSYEDVSGRSVISLDGSVHVGALEAKDRTTLDDAIFAWKAVLGGKSGTYCTAQMVVTKTTFRCDPAMRIHAECPAPNDMAPRVIDVLGVFHDGHMFEVACERNGFAGDETCKQIVETLRMK